MRFPINFNILECNKMGIVIYMFKFTSEDIEYRYVGRTSNFRGRKNNHKNHCYHDNNRQFNQPKYVKIRESGVNWNDIEWEILESEIPYELRREREHYWLTFHNCNLNTRPAERSEKTIRKDNNPSRQPATCECGKTVSRLDYLDKHRLSNRHLKRMEELD
jgi:hypothetical protein